MRCRISGRFVNLEIPLLVLSFYLFRYIEPFTTITRTGSGLNACLQVDLRGRPRQIGSLAGAAHLLNDNTGVLRGAQ